MKSVPYALAVRSLMYAQICTRPNLAFVIGMVGKYQKNLGICHWNRIKKSLRYIQGTNGLMLMYEKYAGCFDTDKSMSGYHGVAPSRVLFHHPHCM
jgi:hypothetical protein